MRENLSMQRHPGKAKGGAVAAVAAFISVLVAFGVPITAEQTEAITMFLVIAGPLVAGWWTDHTTSVPESESDADGS